jgi:hypothetical protein
MDSGCDARPVSKDWAGNWRSLAGLWGIPAAVMLAAVLLEPGLRAVAWSAALVWMGGACIANARRCGRTHCRFTGPFYLLMAMAVVAYATGVLPIGEQGWVILGAATVIGTAALWWGSERILGTFIRSR